MLKSAALAGHKESQTRVRECSKESRLRGCACHPQSAIGTMRQDTRYTMARYAARVILVHLLVKCDLLRDVAINNRPDYRPRPFLVCRSCTNNSSCDWPPHVTNKRRAHWLLPHKRLSLEWNGNPRNNSDLCGEATEIRLPSKHSTI